MKNKKKVHGPKDEMEGSKDKMDKKVEDKMRKEEKRVSKIQERSIKIHAKQRERKLRKEGGTRKIPLIAVIVGIIAGAITYYFTRNITESGIALIAAFVLVLLYFFLKSRLVKSANIKKMEDAFPDFISLMASNLRAGMTVDRALLLSSRKEFAPLDKEIMLLGKDIVTGKEITQALKETGERIPSEKIRKTLKLIISGIKSGGNLAVLLEETSENMRSRGFIEKRAASNVLMYVIFIFFAVAVGAPLLFGLSSVLVNVLTQLLAEVPTDQTISNVPFALSAVSISSTFIFYFALAFILVTDVLASLVLGLVSKGDEREGLKYMVPIIVVSLGVYLSSRLILLNYFGNLFG